MSRHEGVSCDFCMKSNFRGRRYKCLICYDYDLCAECYESNATSTRHTTEHAVQCILTRSMLEVAYGSGSSSRQFQSFTCPYCSKKGFSDTTLLEHVTAEHSESSDNSDVAMEVICPICAASPGGEPNMKTDDLAEHLTLEHHRGGSGSTFEFINEPSAIRHGGVRRISRAAVGPGGVRAARRTNPNFSPSNQEPADRESVDLFAELQQTLAGGSRRQLQQLQMQIQMERQAIENRITNISRRPAGSTAGTASATGTSNANQASISIQRILSAMSNSGSTRAESFMTSSPAARSQFLASVASGGATASNTHTSSSTGSSQLSFIPAGIQLQGLQASQTNDAGSIQIPTVGGQFLMPRFLAPTMGEEEKENLERERSDRSHYVQELLLATTHEISQIVINEPPVEECPFTVEPLNVDESVETHGAQAVFADDSPMGAESMKKSFIRKKDIPSSDDGKKQKSKANDSPTKQTESKSGRKTRENYNRSMLKFLER